MIVFLAKSSFLQKYIKVFCNINTYDINKKAVLTPPKSKISTGNAHGKIYSTRNFEYTKNVSPISVSSS